MEMCSMKKAASMQIGDKVQPLGIELNEPLAWVIIGFIPVGKNKKYKIVIQHPTSKDTLSLENLPYNNKRFK